MKTRIQAEQSQPEAAVAWISIPLTTGSYSPSPTFKFAVQLRDAVHTRSSSNVPLKQSSFLDRSHHLKKRLRFHGHRCVDFVWQVEQDLILSEKVSTDIQATNSSSKGSRPCSRREILRGAALAAGLFTFTQAAKAGDDGRGYTADQVNTSLPTDRSEEETEIKTLPPDAVMETSRNSETVMVSTSSSLPPRSFAQASVTGNMFASATARAAAMTCTYPIDTVKTKLQVSREADDGALGEFQRVLETTGVSGLYSGLFGALVGQIPYAAVTFTAFEILRSYLVPSAAPSMMIPTLLLCGSLGDLAGSLIVVPSEVVKVRMQAGAYHSTLEAFRSIMRDDGGLRGLYAGYTSLLLRDVPFRAIQLTAFEEVKQIWLQMADVAALSPLENLAAGMIAGSIAAILTAPLDVVKTRMMMQHEHGAGSDSSSEAESNFPRYKNEFDALVRIPREEGFGALLKGALPRVAETGPMSAIFFPVYEAFRHYLGVAL